MIYRIKLPIIAPHQALEIGKASLLTRGRSGFSSEWGMRNNFGMRNDR